MKGLVVLQQENQPKISSFGQKFLLLSPVAPRFQISVCSLLQGAGKVSIDSSSGEQTNGFLDTNTVS